MAALKSTQDAQEYLRKCLRGIPTSWWSDFDGQNVVDILRELEINTSAREPSAQRLYQDVHKRLRPNCTIAGPTRMQFLALCLHEGLSWTGDKFLDRIWEKCLTHIIVWHQMDPDPPAPNDPIESWRTWFSVIRRNLWPSSEAVAGMSRAQREFRDAVLRVEVTEVTQKRIVWSIPVDILRDASVLEQHFRDVIRRGANTTPQQASGGAATSEQSQGWPRSQDTQVTTTENHPPQSWSNRHEGTTQGEYMAGPSPVQRQKCDPVPSTQNQQGYSAPSLTQQLQGDAVRSFTHQQQAENVQPVLPEIPHEDPPASPIDLPDHHQSPVQPLLKYLSTTVSTAVKEGNCILLESQTAERNAKNDATQTQREMKASAQKQPMARSHLAILNDPTRQINPAASKTTLSGRTLALGVDMDDLSAPSQLQITERAMGIQDSETLSNTQAIVRDFATFFEDLRRRERRNIHELQALDDHLDNLKGHIIQSVGLQIEIRLEQQSFKDHPTVVQELERIRLDGLQRTEGSVREQADLEGRREKLVETSIHNRLIMRKAQDTYDEWIRSLVEEGVIERQE